MFDQYLHHAAVLYIGLCQGIRIINVHLFTLLALRKIVTLRDEYLLVYITTQLVIVQVETYRSFACCSKIRLALGYSTKACNNKSKTNLAIQERALYNHLFHWHSNSLFS